jgi:hypothetical protein
MALSTRKGQAAALRIMRYGTALPGFARLKKINCAALAPRACVLNPCADGANPTALRHEKTGLLIRPGRSERVRRNPGASQNQKIVPEAQSAQKKTRQIDSGALCRETSYSASVANPKRLANRWAR